MRLPDRALCSSFDGRLSEYHVEQRYLRQDRSIVWANASVSLIPGSDEEEPMLVKVIEDITERKRAEDRLLNAQAELAHATRVAMIGELSGVDRSRDQPAARSNCKQRGRLPSTCR